MKSASTEARMSLRESVRIFSILQNSSHNFEDLCYRYSAKHEDMYKFSRDISSATCGNFVRAFVSLFIRKNEINRVSLNKLIDGSALQQYYNHTNLVMYSFRHESKYLPAACNSIFSDVSDAFSKWQASYASKQLSTQLLLFEECEYFPRIFIVSMSWVLINHPCQACSSASIKDHKFVIIKHNNDSFQLVQNYISDYNMAGKNRNAMSLRSWQDSQHRYSSRSGFDKAAMLSFLDSLGCFAVSGETGFCATKHEEMFGVKLLESNEYDAFPLQYWPSISFMEIDDDCVVGFGSRCMAEQLLIDCKLPLESI